MHALTLLHQCALLLLLYQLRAQQLISSPMTSALEQLQERSQFDGDGNPTANHTAGDDSDIEQPTIAANDDSDDELPQHISDGKLSYDIIHHLYTSYSYVPLMLTAGNLSVMLYVFTASISHCSDFISLLHHRVSHSRYLR
jgi:hypothetical protein